MSAPAVEQAQVALAKFRRAPVGFATEVLGVTPRLHQARILNSIRDRRRTLVLSCNSLGKDFIAAVATHWWLQVWEEALVVTTAPTGEQVKNIQWKEIRHLHQRARFPLGGTMPEVEPVYRISVKRHAFGLATRDEAERMSGHHEAHILIIVTEGSAVSDETFDGIFSMMASGDVRLLVLSNPTRNEGEVYEIAQGNRSNWYVLQVSGWDLPNLLACTKLGEEHLAKSAEQLERDGDCPNPTPYLLTHLFERETAENFGEDSDYYAIHVLGKHGRSGKDQLIPREWIDLAFEREPLPGKAAGGLDIARGGRDHSAYAEVNGNAIVRLEEWSKLEPNQTVGRMLGILEDRDFPVAVDDTGLGGGVAPLLKETYRKVFGIDFSERAEDETRFANKPAEMYWYLRKRLDPDGPDPLSFKLVPAPARKRMTLQMLKPTFATKDSKGRLSVDKKGGGSESPDTTDAIILALEAQGRAGYSGIRLNREYDRTDPDLRRSEFAGVGEKRF